VRLEERVAHHLGHQLVLLLHAGPRFGRVKTSNTLRAGVPTGKRGESMRGVPPWRCRSGRDRRWLP
jgi:hypothetical protein